LLNINRRYHQSNRRSLGPAGMRSSAHAIASQATQDLPPFAPPSLSASAFNGSLPTDSDIRKGLLDIVSEFESLEEDEEGPLESGSTTSSLTDESEIGLDGLQSQDAEIAAAAASAAAASAAALSRSKRSKRKKDFDMTAADIVQHMPILQPGSALLGASESYSGQPRVPTVMPSPGSVVKQLMTSAAEIPNPTPGANANRTAAARLGMSGANIAAAAKNALTQRLIDMVKKTASQQGAGPVQVVSDAASAFEDQCRVSSRGRKRKAKATTSVDGEEDQLSFEQDDELISVQPTGAIVVRHHYIPVQSDGTAMKGSSPKMPPRVITEDPQFEELDEETEDEDEDDYDYQDASNPMKVVPRVAPAAGVVPPGSAGKSAVPPPMGAPQAAAKRQHLGANGSRGTPPVVAAAAALVSGANSKVGAPVLPAATSKVSGAARKSAGGFRAGNGHSTHHHHHSAAHQQYVATTFQVANLVVLTVFLQYLVPRTWPANWMTASGMSKRPRSVNV
jgi:hypothetical protein